jgi:hypothetical protein
MAKPAPKAEGPAPLVRLAALERQNRRLRRALVVLAAVVIVALGAAAVALVAPYNAQVGLYLGQLLGRPEVVETKKTIVEAEQFVLRARDGRVRATLGLRGENSMGLDLYDAAGKARAGLDLGSDGEANLWLGADDGQVAASFNGRGVRIGASGRPGASLTPAGLSLLDAAQRPRVTLAAKEDGTTSLTLNDREGKTGALVDVAAEGSRLGLFYGGGVRAGIGYGRGGSQLNLFSEDGQDHATLSLMPDGSTSLLFHDQQGHQRIALGVLANDVAGLSLFDKGDKQRGTLSVTGDNTPHLELYDGAGARRAALALSAEGLPGLQLEDRGQPRAVLGVSAGGDGRRTARATSASSLLLFDKDGALVFQAPVY